MPLAYDELHQIASGYVARERRPDASVSPTILVNELFVRLIRQRKIDWIDRKHFFTFAAKLMRFILVDHARARRSPLRSGTIPLSEELLWVSLDGADYLDLDRALEELEALDPVKCAVVELRVLLGCGAAETAGILDISKATVDRYLNFSKAWLYQRLNPGG